jgi:DNA-binding NarL/FixJ family response regulator
VASRRVLVIDDVVDMRFLLRSYLEARGFEVVAEASSPTEGLNLARRYEPDGVLIDLHIPGHDSVAVIAELRAALSEVRILAVSATVPTEATARQAIEAGADAFFDKAAGFRDLTRVLDELLS